MNNSIGNMVGSGSAGMGRTITSGGLTVPGITSRMNLTANAGNGNLNVQGSNRLMSGMLPQGNIFCGCAIYIYRERERELV
jgi:CCR4-NOT transcription complex subunit 2